MKMNKSDKTKSDICLILEGTFPYVTGGVSSWIYEIILNHPNLSFNIITIVPSNQKLEYKYSIPKNVVSIKNLFLYKFPKRKKIHNQKKCDFFSEKLGTLLKNILSKKKSSALEDLINFITANKSLLGSQTIFNSKTSWKLIRNLYDELMPNSSFSDFFWSWRSLFGGLFTVLLTDLPEADCYHSVCTGYAGMMLARAKIEKNKPCFLTEHGIYTNERRIEIATAEWLYDNKQFNLSIRKTNVTAGLQELWSNIFTNYSMYCYRACEYIITLYEGNRKLQLLDGAPYTKTRIIPNGIDFKRFSKIKRKKHPRPTIALIGRVVPIKDVKTYIQAVSFVKLSIPNVLAYIMGPTDEDKEYYNECVELVDYNDLNKNIEFTGKVKIDDYLAKIDLLVLTSLSEAQPLVILEGGAAGIPTVTTNVGACREMIYGKDNEKPQLGSGGAVTSLANARATGNAIIKFLTDYAYYTQNSDTIQKRVEKYYRMEQQHNAYNDIYNKLINSTKI
jgi:polysaccharide biosynthesis protein PelF